MSTEELGNSTDRREQVLDAALVVFGRFGFRKTSMDQVAQAADISRPGLYFLFESKQALFRAAVKSALDAAFDDVEAVLDDTSISPGERLVRALDEWSGRYVGSVPGEVGELIATSGALLNDLFESYGQLFDEAMARMIRAERQTFPSTRHLDPLQIAQTLHATASGWGAKLQTRDEFLRRITWAVQLTLEPGQMPNPARARSPSAERELTPSVRAEMGARDPTVVLSGTIQIRRLC